MMITTIFLSLSILIIDIYYAFVSGTQLKYYISEKKVQEALAIRGFGIRGFDYSRT